MITAVLLSAGESRRFGSPKALAELNSGLVIERISQTLLSSQVDEVIIVLGCHADLIKPFLLNHKKVKVVYNKDYNFGQTSSFLRGLRSLSESAQGILLLPVDYPFVKRETVDLLVSLFRKEKCRNILIPSFENRKGHPPLFPVILKDKFLRLDNTQGIHLVSRQHKEITKIINTDDPGVTSSFNTREEFEDLKKVFE